jgi:hypothetical protein
MRDRGLLALLPGLACAPLVPKRLEQAASRSTSRHSIANHSDRRIPVSEANTTAGAYFGPSSFRDEVDLRLRERGGSPRPSAEDSARPASRGSSSYAPTGSTYKTTPTPRPRPRPWRVGMREVWREVLHDFNRCHVASAIESNDCGGLRSTGECRHLLASVGHVQPVEVLGDGQRSIGVVGVGDLRDRRRRSSTTLPLAGS